MVLTIAQLHEIRRIIESHHQAFVVNTIGVDVVAPEVLKKLKSMGLVNVQINSIEEAYLFGQAIAASENPKVAKMSYEDFKAWLRKNPIPLSDVERRAVSFAKQQAGQYVVGLGNRVNTQTGQIMIEADAQLRAKTRETIRDATANNIARRETVKKLKSDLGWSKKDWSRDWDRIAVTEKHTAMQRGTADHYAEMYGSETLVAKRPTPDACKHCKRLHLGPDGQPRIFKLSTLEANGLNNFGRRAADWLPVVGSTHPFCQCTLVRIPAGWGFDEEGSLVPGGELGVRYEDGADFVKSLYREDLLQKAYALEGHVEFQGLDIRIENKVGSKRHWKDVDTGEAGTTTMLYAYGYVANTNGPDEDEIDVFLGPDPKSRMVYIVHQQNPKTGRYDEDKCMLGFSCEAHARMAYQQHYNRPDFYVTISPMELEHFKRWIRVTGDFEKLLKSGLPNETFIIPLCKGEFKTTVSGDSNTSAATSRAGARSPGPGTVINYLAGVEPRESPTVSKEMREAHREFLEDAKFKNTKVKRKKEDMIFDSPMDRRSYRYEAVLPATWGTVTSEEVEANREDLERRHPKDGGIGNAVEDSEDERVEKSAGVTPIGGTTKGGYLKVAKGVYVKPGAKGHKGKGQGQSLPKHVVMGNFERQGEVSLIAKSDMTPPNVYAGLLQRGHSITINKPGKQSKSGTLSGYNYQGRPVVKYDGKQRTTQWSSVTAPQDQKYVPVYEHLSRSDSLIKADDRQSKLVDSVLQFEVGKGKPAQAYMDWLLDRGNEVFLIGGIVRDLVRGTAPDSVMDDESIKESMKDIDIVSTAHPQIALQMAKAVGGQKIKDNSGWGVATIQDGVGLDVCSIASVDGNNFKEGMGVYDHDLEDDVQRRDFTVNCLSYDVRNKVIVDPTGQGYADAQANVLRLAPTVTNAERNTTLPMRFWKFRARGWKTEAKTLSYMKKHLPNMKEHDISKELVKIVAKGPQSPLSIWSKLKHAMIEDGAYDLYQAHIKPLKQQVMEKLG